MALDSPYTGIVDWRVVALQYGKDFVEVGGEVVTDCEVTDIALSNESPAGSTEGNKHFITSINETNEALFEMLSIYLTHRNEISNWNQRQKGENGSLCYL